MPRDPRYDVLFEPVAIGPVTAPNRFYQVPHCSGMGRARPRALAAMRAVKAEGGWGVVNTEYCSIHPSSDDTPYPFASLWDDDDVRAHAMMVESVKRHGALAGVELWYGGSYVASLATRQPPLDLLSVPSRDDPVQCRVMDRRDIADLRRWHRDAARRAVGAGFDIIYVYAAHGYLLHHFLSPVTNTRSDEYGGSAANRARIVRELLEETREAIGPDRALAIRFPVAHVGGDGPSTADLHEMMSLLGPLADLWDVVVDDYAFEMGSSRFVEEAAQERWAAQVRAIVGRPVVGVGRFTTPDTMVRMVRDGILDLVGAARPSIADPFLPAKIRDGRLEEIRECIGCNICYASDSRGSPLRCTQNPTMGEEWRSAWHPERIEAAGSSRAVLVVGAGPAGLEAAVALARRGYTVTLADAANAPGGRINRECALPGLSTWARVRDHRLQLAAGLSNLSIYPGSELCADDVVALGAPVVVIATGSRWRRDGVGRHHRSPVAGFDHAAVFTPDDLTDPAAPSLPRGPVVIYDDDGYYMAVVLAERCARGGARVTLVTAGTAAAEWTRYTNEFHQTNARLVEQGIAVVPNHAVCGFGGENVRIECVFTGRVRELPASAVVSVTARVPSDSLYHTLADREDHRIELLERVGDCLAPGLIAHAVHGGHRFARHLDAQPETFASRRETGLV